MSEVRKCPYEPEVNCLGKRCDIPKLVTLERCWMVKDEKAKRRNKTRK